MEMRLVIAEVVSRFDMEFPVGMNGSEFVDGNTDQFTWKLSDLHICFRARG